MSINAFDADENLAHIKDNIVALDEGRGVMHEFNDSIKVWAPEAWDDYRMWKTCNVDIHAYIKTLIESIEKEGVSKGIGNPEQLKDDLSEIWTRQIDDKQMLVYRVEKGNLQIVACMNH